jgi:hypothetical protein
MPTSFPVKKPDSSLEAGLVKTAEEYKWSSYQEYIKKTFNKAVLIIERKGKL